MKKNHVIDCCELFFSMTGLPVLYYSTEGQLEAAYPMWLMQTLVSSNHPGFAQETNPATCLSASQGSYGRITLEDGGHVIVGPAYSVPYSEELVRCYMRENGIPIDRWDQAKATLIQIPEMNYQKFTRHLAFLHYSLTQEKVHISEHFEFNDSVKSRSISTMQTRETTEAKENGIRHNTFDYENELYARIKEGDTKKLLDYMVRYNAVNLYRGHLSDRPLQNAQNKFVVAVTKVGILAAIPGKLDVETTYQLIDSYIRECDRAGSVAEVERLEYIMVMDFCRRIGENRAPKGISQEIYSCMNFIREKTNEHITVGDVAGHIGRSQSYLNVHFKEEAGITVSAYIMQCKLEEAARLLEFSDRTLAEISCILCFSSQSYFQNLFKKEYGMTPMQYRKIHHSSAADMFRER